MNPSAFTEIDSQAVHLVEGLTHEQFNWKPGPGRWSVGECLDHLSRMGYQLLPGLDAAIRSGRKRGLTGSPPFRRGLLGGYFVRMNAPVPARKLPTVRAYVPAAGGNLDREVTLERFRALQRELAKRVREAEGLDLGRIRVASPAFPLVRFTLATWFDATVDHERRHLRQARDVTEEPHFPPSA